MIAHEEEYVELPAGHIIVSELHPSVPQQVKLFRLDLDAAGKRRSCESYNGSLDWGKPSIVESSSQATKRT